MNKDKQIEPLTLDQIKRLPKKDQADAINRYWKWLKHVRKQDKNAVKRQELRVYAFKNPEKMKQWYEDAKRRSREKTQKRLKVLKCIECEREFKQTTIRQRYCSSKCYTRKNSRGRYKAKPKEEVKCFLCGEIFLRMRTDHRYCSQRCRQKVLYWEKRAKQQQQKKQKVYKEV